MPWRHLFRAFTNNPQLIQRLSETGPIRAAARLTVYWYNEARYKGKDALENFKSERPNTNSSDSPGFLARFKQELKSEMNKTAEKRDLTQGSKERKNTNEFKSGYKQRWQEPSDQQNRKGRP